MWDVVKTLGSSPLWGDGFTLFLSIVVQALPFLLLGIGLSGILSIFVDARQLARWLPSGSWSSSLAGGLLGFFFPVCECGNLPVARQLVIKGIPAHVAIAFLLAAPVFNPVVILSTWIAFRDQPELVVYRVVLSLVIAVVVGWIFSRQSDPELLLNPTVWRELQRLKAPPPPSSFLQTGTFLLPSSPLATVQTAEQAYRTVVLEAEARPTVTDPNRWHRLVQTWVRELRELGAVLVLGAAMAALIQTLMPRTFLLEYGQDPVLSVVVMLVLATIVSICSTVDAFFALAFSATFTTGSLLAFLVFGPMIDLKAIGLMFTLFRPKVIGYLILLALQFSTLAALVVNFYT